MTHDVTKLPRWARDTIKSLERDNEELRDRIDDITGCSPEGGFPEVIADPFGVKPIGLTHPLGIVEYPIGVRERLEVRRVSKRDRLFELHGSGALRITPAVTNHVYVEVVDSFGKGV